VVLRHAPMRNIVYVQSVEGCTRLTAQALSETPCAPAMLAQWAQQ
jgi:hypothetical protein